MQCDLNQTPANKLLLAKAELVLRGTHTVGNIMAIEQLLDAPKTQIEITKRTLFESAATARELVAQLRTAAPEAIDGLLKEIRQHNRQSIRAQSLAGFKTYAA